jgi:hypothetical protein
VSHSGQQKRLNAKQLACKVCNVTSHVSLYRHTQCCYGSICCWRAVICHRTVQSVETGIVERNLSLSRRDAAVGAGACETFAQRHIRLCRDTWYVAAWMARVMAVGDSSYSELSAPLMSAAPVDCDQFTRRQAGACSDLLT